VTLRLQELLVGRMKNREPIGLGVSLVANRLVFGPLTSTLVFSL